MDIFVARQPILDAEEALFAYELLFRSGPENVFSHPDADEASLGNLTTSVIGFGLTTLTGGRAAFVNASRRVIVEDWYAVLPPERVVIELLETVAPDAEVLEGCRRLKARGYELALDDFVYDAAYDELLALADYVKIDFLVSDDATRARMARDLGARGIKLVAEKVETREDWLRARELGYGYFQGYYFLRPEMVAGRDVRPSKVNQLRFIQEINRPELDFERIEGLIRQEVGLAVKLLRYLNSAGFGWRYEVTSIGQAIRLLGEKTIRKWASLVAVSALAEGKPAQLVVTCLVRARFAELLAGPAGLAGRDLDLFLVGLLSGLDALMDRPLAELLEPLTIPDDVRSALTTGAPPLGDVLAVVLAHEQGDWGRLSEATGRAGVDEAAVREAYRAASAWADGIAAS